MHDDELKQMWQSASQLDVFRFINSTKSLKEMNAKIQKLDYSIEQRNLREVAAGVFVAGGAIVFLVMEDSLMSKICAGLIVLATIFIVYKLLKVRKLGKLPNSSASIREHLEHNRQYLIAERNLLENIAYWYILPITIPLVVWVLNAPWIPWIKAVYLPFVALVAVGIYWYNQKGVKRFDESIRELDKAIKQLEE